MGGLEKIFEIQTTWKRVRNFCKRLIGEKSKGVLQKKA
jgi:hypothetical protein